MHSPFPFIELKGEEKPPFLSPSITLFAAIILSSIGGEEGAIKVGGATI